MTTAFAVAQTLTASAPSRVSVGEQFLTVYPNLNASVKDTKNPDGTVKDVATAKMVNVMKGKSYMVGCDGYYRMLFLVRQDGKIRCF